MAVRSAETASVPQWQRGKVASWLVTVDHKRIGILYIATAGLFFVAGGIMAELIRTQLIAPDQTIVTGNDYNQLVTIHGTTMIFLVVVPMLAGLANFLVPVMIGAPDMAFPRLNALSYWLYLFGGSVLMLSFLAEGGAAQAGWTSYVPLATQTAGHGQDLWILSLHMLGISSLIGAINFIATIHNMRAPGMTWMRIPLFVWSIEVFAWLLVLVLPTIAAGVTMMLLDRQAGTHFFAPSHGGPILYQHAFWFFGHPEVYIMILPAMGIISEILPVFSRKPIFGYKAIALSTVAIGFFSMLVWAHHMFTVGLPNYLNAFFMLSSMAIAIPTGMKIFNWLATLWRGNISLDTPMLFALGGLTSFLLGGVTGIFLGSAATDIYLHGTYFVVAHFHYTLFPVTFFAGFAGLYYWYPKMFGRMMDETLGKVHFWLTMLSFQAVFLPLFLSGIAGTPRRVFAPNEYPLFNSIQPLQVYSTIASVGLLLAQIPFIVNFFLSLARGKEAEHNPWLANTLEWSVASPPPHENFAGTPHVRRWPYEYSAPGGKLDWSPQAESVEITLPAANR